MTDDTAFAARAQEILTEESEQPLAWWWLSFCDPNRPTGSQFIGACLVKATGFLSATMVARALGCNPGGEVQGVGPTPLEANVQDGWAERLLTKEECAEFDRIHDGAL